MGLTEAIVKFLSKIFAGNEWLSVTVAAMFPMIEVRGAIPIALGFGMSYGQAFLWAGFSAVIITPVLFFLFKPLLNWLKRFKWFKRFAVAVEKIFEEKALKIENDAKKRAKASGLSEAELEKTAKNKLDFYKTIGILIFVGVPLPFTGVWTGSVVAAFLDLKAYYALPAIIVGNFLASAIVLMLCVLLGAQLMDIVLYVLFAFILITVATLVLSIIKKHSKERKSEEPKKD